MEKKVISFLEKNNGSITTKQFEAIGIRRYKIKNFVDKNIVKRIARGIYITPDNYQDELYNYQSKHNNTIFSYNTSLYILGLIDKPKYIDITTYRGNNPIENKKINIHWVSKSKLNLGVILKKTKIGNIVKVYNLERTLCDIIKNDSFSKNEYSKILTWYFKNSKDDSLLIRYSKIMKIEKKLNIVKDILLNK